MKKALYRKRICAEKEKLTPEKVFHTPQYRDLLTSIGHEITGGKLTTLRLYDDKNSGIAGWNQGETVAVNLGNQITSSFLTLELKSDSLIGILGHECGHYRYTDSALRKRYAEHMLNGSWYPKEPVPENAQEKEALDAMNVYFERKDKAILSIFLQTASYLSNLLNDMYIEEKMCALFPGSIRRGILMNRDRNVEWLPTLREMLETEKDRLSILMNLCAQYALSSRVNAWDGADYELIDTLKLLMPVIDEAGKAADDMERYLATNHILLIDDILYEGDTLHHCVNKTDTYFDRIVSKESYILFLREKENPKVPFYTLEVEPDGTIRQKRAEFNRQNKDIDKVTSFLTLWQKEIQKRLTQKDRKSTEESRKLRQQNYQEIRDKHVVVHGGAFAGELLADLLEKDLMDLPVESAENEESPTEIAA
ncbi:PcfJ domain-containing protein [Blautia obeum]|uniref:PcfJ domain-containing protein n=1 Tax=Blautia obeum TaxID=40520 RepID=UPI00156D67D4|nr:PcfJ domain-containing protein [Blautia obeum]NSJ93620.1 hypothetical protein [Blautia obeum]